MFATPDLYFDHIPDCEIPSTKRRRLLSQEDLSTTITTDDLTNLPQQISTALDQQFECHGPFRYKLTTTHCANDGCYPASPIATSSAWGQYRRLENTTRITDSIASHVFEIQSAKCTAVTCSAKTIQHQKKVIGCEISLQKLACTNRTTVCYKCNESKWYSNLKEHLTVCVGTGQFCPRCETMLVGQSEIQINQHFMTCSRVNYPCRKRCGQAFTSASRREAHSKNCHPQSIAARSEPRAPLDNSGLMISAIDKHFRIIQISPSSPSNDYEVTLDEEKPRIKDILLNNLQYLKSLKFYISINIECKKLIEETHLKTANFRSSASPLLLTSDLDELLEQHLNRIADKIDKYCRNGSGYVMEGVSELNIYICKYTPLQGGSWIETPQDLQKKKCSLLNIQSTDDKCFLHCAAAVKHPLPRSKKNVKNQPKSYEPFLSEFDTSGLTFPLQLKDIKRFEELNQFKVNVIGYDMIEEESEDDDGEVKSASVLFPLLCSDNKDPSALVMNLLLLKNETTEHFVLITNISGFLRKSNSNNKRHHCVRCFHGFSSIKRLNNHLPDCILQKPQAVEMPHDPLLHYKSYRYEVEMPAFLSADFETVLVKQIVTSNGKTTVIDHHKPCGYALKIVTPYTQYQQPIRTYRGVDSASQFIESLKEVSTHLQPLMERNVPMLPLTPAQDRAFNSTSKCYLCLQHIAVRRDLTEGSKENFKVHDHDHYTGQYIGPAHRLCNLERKTDKRIPLLFHSLRSYDSHLFIEELCKAEKNLQKIRLIPKTLESYSSIITTKFRILDSLQHLTFPLDTLVKNLTNNGSTHEHLHVLKAHVLERYGPNNQKKLELLSRKGVYPYGYMDSFERFDEGLPPKAAFYNNLKDEHISEADWLHVQEVWKEFDLKTLGDLHDLYVEGDTLLLADIIQKYRRLILKEYHLDPLHFYTLPGLAFQACLRHTRVELELIKDMEMFLMLEKSIRGGISVISKRHATANNPELSDFDPNKDTSHLLYLDASNLYGAAMSQKVPVGGFVWHKETISEDFILNYDAANSDEGFILEVDVDIPEAIHDHTDEYPLCPEHLDINQDMISDITKEIRHKRGGKSVFTAKKLAPNLFHKEKYVTDIRNLKFYMEQGATLKKIHRVLKFKQEAWIEPYIAHNTDLRNAAILINDDMGKALFKLLNNALFGKTIESVRKRISVVLVNSERSARWQTSKCGFKRFTTFNNNLVAVECIKPKVVLDKPIYIGFTVLETSKRIMMDMHYNTIKKKYPGDLSALCFTDTDSFLYHIQTGNLGADMVEMGKFDFSNYPESHPLKNKCPQNTGRLGFFKNETKGYPIKEFIGLRSKMYSIMVEENGRQEQKATAAGIKECVRKKVLNHERYRAALESGGVDQFISQKTFRAVKHQIQTIRQSRVGLSAYDDKRFILKDHSTKAHGHYKNGYFNILEMLEGVIEE